MSLPSVKAALASALRDYVVDGVPSTGPNEPEKASLRAALLALADMTASSGATLVFATIAEMGAAPDPVEVGARAEVRADPAGDVEDGNGVYGWSGSAWVWISPLIPDSVVDLIQSTQPVVECTVTNSGALVTFTPKAGYKVDPTGTQTFRGRSSFTNVGNVYVEVIGYNSGDHRQVLMVGEPTLRPGVIRANDTMEISSLNAAARFNLVSVTPYAPSRYVTVKLVDGGANSWVLAPLSPVPDVDGIDTVFRFPNPPTKAPGEILARIQGINDSEAWPVLGPTGDPVNDRLLGDSYWTSADTLEFDRFGGARWRILRVANPTLAKLGDGAASSEAAFWAAANSRIYAQRSFGR